ncbi:hypothetical protein JIX56_00730 [Streptomyces sp. CA-210063]|uniref:hypothetical protein n=1 Tax=Streptomyces sp. CA-210063 TaxID=2801029 RepID=UPI00214B1A14|nr:hypothetical protein [Streptomyces sp. CA-210063]UUU28548.1 hypothetical protein JIX56_00730 [Streptomyces sp. CA-210063]
MQQHGSVDLRDPSAGLGALRPIGMALYVLSCFHAWQLLDSWLTHHRRPNAKVRRLLIEQLLTCNPDA